MARKKKKGISRRIVFTGTNKEGRISKVTSISSGQRMIHFDQLPDGTWRMIYNDDMFPDLRELEGIEIVRD